MKTIEIRIPDDTPEWANWLSVDASGLTWLWEAQPDLDDNVWTTSDDDETINREAPFTNMYLGFPVLIKLRKPIVTHDGSGNFQSFLRDMRDLIEQYQ